MTAGQPDAGDEVHGRDEVDGGIDDFAHRFARLAAGYRGGPDPSDPAAVRAMPIVLHIPKTDPPSPPELLAAAASACVLVCLAPAAGAGGDWFEPVTAWLSGRIRKIARRARGAHWTAVQSVPGVTVTGPTGAQARAFVPGPVGAVDRRIGRLQIGGTALAEVADSGTTAVQGQWAPVLWVRDALHMTVGKAAAQVGHASMLVAAMFDPTAAARWYRDGCPCTVRYADEATWAHLEERVAAGTAIAVRDAGYTEVDPGARTVIATADR